MQYETYLRGLDYGFDDRHHKALDRMRILIAALPSPANQVVEEYNANEF